MGFAFDINAPGLAAPVHPSGISVGLQGAVTVLTGTGLFQEIGEPIFLFLCSGSPGHIEISTPATIVPGFAETFIGTFLFQGTP